MCISLGLLGYLFFFFLISKRRRASAEKSTLACSDIVLQPNCLISSSWSVAICILSRTHCLSASIANFCYSKQLPVFPRMAFNSPRQKAAVHCKRVGGESDSSRAASLRKKRREENATELHDYSTLAQNGWSIHCICFYLFGDKSAINHRFSGDIHTIQYMAKTKWTSHGINELVTLWDGFSTRLL